MISEAALFAVRGMAKTEEVEAATLFGEPMMEFDKEDIARAAVWFGKRYQELLEDRAARRIK